MLNEFFVLFKCVESIGSGYIYMHTYVIGKNLSHSFITVKSFPLRCSMTQIPMSNAQIKKKANEIQIDRVVNRACMYA